MRSDSKDSTKADYLRISWRESKGNTFSRRKEELRGFGEGRLNHHPREETVKVKGAHDTKHRVEAH